MMLLSLNDTFTLRASSIIDKFKKSSELVAPHFLFTYDGAYLIYSRPSGNFISGVLSNFFDSFIRRLQHYYPMTVLSTSKVTFGE